VRGVPGDGVPRLAKVQRERDEKRGTLLRCSRRFFNLGVYQFKLSLYRDLAKDNPEEKGYISFPRGLPESYFEELVCERRVPYKRTGAIAYRWKKPAARLTMDDCFLCASAAAIKYGVNWISDHGWAQPRAEFETPRPAASSAAKKTRSLASQQAR
jgi:phage terminase large subunit GpA-like protein